uniref:interferon-induced protein 44-like isoform X3 n=1 Tax=Myodes glareolus TaxID=447135 RepID=UPI002022949C|nr:interferon-induced protein 44-like isoform X3 [Myodes glareolus]
MEVTTRLTWIQEKLLEQLLGKASLTLLYKSSVHQFITLDITKRCSNQGSTMTVIHLKQNIVGVFMLEQFPLLRSEKSSTCVWFSFRQGSSTGMSALVLNTQVEVSVTQLKFFSPGGFSLIVDPRNYELHLSAEVIKELQLDLKGVSPYLECEIFRVDGIKRDPEFIKKMVTVKQYRKKLLSALRAYRPHEDLVPEVRILLVGPVGSGKSSFFNSVKSAFQGHLTRQAIVGSDEDSVTKQFNPCKPKEVRLSTYCTSPPLKDRIHCVAYVLNINSVNMLSDQMVAKLKKIHRDAVHCGVREVALLTNVNNCDEVLDDNFLNMTESMTSRSQVKNVQDMLNIPIANILMVSNYALERSLDPLKDVLIFAALNQMLRTANDSLEDLFLKETASANDSLKRRSRLRK